MKGHLQEAFPNLSGKVIDSLSTPGLTLDAPCHSTGRYLLRGGRVGVLPVLPFEEQGCHLLFTPTCSSPCPPLSDGEPARSPTNPVNDSAGLSGVQGNVSSECSLPASSVKLFKLKKKKSNQCEDGLACRLGSRGPQALGAHLLAPGSSCRSHPSHVCPAAAQPPRLRGEQSA